MATIDHFKNLLHLYKNLEFKYRVEADKAANIADTYREAAYKLENAIDKTNEEDIKQ